MEARLEGSFLDDDVFGGTQPAAFWRSLAADVVAQVGADWLEHPRGVLDAGDVVKSRFEALQPRFDDVGWVVSVAQRALDSFERNGSSTTLAVARHALDFSYTLGAPRLPQLIALRDGLRDIVGGYERIMADYRRETGHESLDPVVLKLVAAQRRRDQVAADAPPVPEAPRLEPESDIASALIALAPLAPENPVGEPRPAKAHLLRAAWELAIVEAGKRGDDPSDDVLAAIIEGDKGLLFIAKLPRGTTRTEIRQLHARYEKVAAEATRWQQRAPASPEPEKSS